jgi:hypothetical protein
MEGSILPDMAVHVSQVSKLYHSLRGVVTAIHQVA